MSMTLAEAMLVTVGLAAKHYRISSDEVDALNVILAALPAPEKRTPGQTLWDADQYFGPNPSGVKARPWSECSTPARWEHGAIAVLREHGPDLVLTDAALSAPEKRTPGQTYHDGLEAHFVNKDGGQATPWRKTSPRYREGCEAGALAALREHAVDYVLRRDDVIEAGCQAWSECPGHLGEIAAFRAAVKARLAEAEVKP